MSTAPMNADQQCSALWRETSGVRPTCRRCRTHADCP